MTRTVLFFLCLLPAIYTFSQEKQIADSSELLENIHLHLNKTTFLQGERLWFKAYLRNQNSKLPSLTTTNLHVGIFSQEGRELHQKLLYVENGMAHGDIAIDSTFTDTEYTVLAWTNYMRNFKDLLPYRQKIKVLKDDVEQDVDEVKMKISIFPEGGQLIVGAFNQIGILVDNGLGQGVAVNNLELVDDTGKVIRQNIVTNKFGMGKTGFLVDSDKRYYLQRQRPSLSMIREQLPIAIIDQIGLNIDNTGRDKVLFKLVASNATFEANQGNTFTMALYQDDFTLLKDIEIIRDEPVISLNRKEIPYGVLTTVLFDKESKPIAYRMFFNHREDGLLGNVEIEHCLTAFGDSIQVDLILPKGSGRGANVSISVLPEASLGFNPDNSILSSFLLRPYVTTYFQDHYFFERQDRKKRFELDIRLLIEGWGRYDWDSKQLQTVKKVYELESGIPFKGKVIDADLLQERQVSIIAELSGAIGFEELQNDKSFMGNMVLFEGDSLGISLISNKGKLRKPKVDVQFENGLKEPLEAKAWMTNETMKKKGEIIEEMLIDEPFNIGKRTIALEEVTVIDKAWKPNKIEMFVVGMLPISEGRIIGDVEIERYNNVAHYLATLGYSRSRGLDGDGFFIDILLSPKSNTPVAVDGNLLNLPLSRVQAIYFDIDKKEYVSIVLRSNPYEKPEDRNKFIKFVIKNGYARPQDYFTPNYSGYSSLVFKNYGTIDWRSNISVGIDVPTSITVPIKNQDKIQLILEGMTYNGLLVSESKLFHVGN